jgi:hypothetical protein
LIYGIAPNLEEKRPTPSASNCTQDHGQSKNTPKANSKPTLLFSQWLFFGMLQVKFIRTPILLLRANHGKLS